MATALGRQATALRRWDGGSARAGQSRASEYRILLVAGPIGAAIVAGMALNLAPLTTGAALAAFLAAVVSPPVGLAVLAIMAPLKSPLVIPAPGFNTILVGAVLLGYVYRLPIDRPQLRMNAPLLLLLGFVLFVSAQQAPEMLSGYSGTDGHLVGYQFVQLLTNAGLVVATACVVGGRKPYPFLGAALVSAAAAGIIAIATFENPAAGPLSGLVAQSDAASRAVGPFGDPNYFGLFEATASVAALAWLAVSGVGRLRWLLLGTLTVLALALLVSLSRAALVALLAGFLSVAFARSRTAGAIAVGVALLLAVVAYPLFVQWRLSATNGAPSGQAYVIMAQSDQGRLEAAFAGAQLFASSPLFGIGFGHYSLMSEQIIGTRIAAHNWYVNVLAEQGIVGIVLWILMLVGVIIALRRTSNSARFVGTAVFATYVVGSVFLEPPNSVQTSALAVIVIVAALVGDWEDIPTRQANGLLQDGLPDEGAMTGGILG